MHETLLDHMIDDDRIWRHTMHIQLIRYVRESNALTIEYLLQILVQINELFLLIVLQLVHLDILPQGLYNNGPCGRMYAK